MIFREKIEKAISETGKSKNALANILGVPRTTFNHWITCDQGEPGPHIQRWLLRDLEIIKARGSLKDEPLS